MFWGCSGGDGKTAAGPEINLKKNGLVGLWLTQGIDPDLGAVNVAMTLRADGKLTIVQELPAGARLSFSGTWELDDAKLTLNGVYFTPSGQSQVGCQITQAGLELKDEAGKTQIWRRAE